jgi:olefin beta-lactone synthetase
MSERKGILESLAARAKNNPGQTALTSPRGKLTCLQIETLSNQASRAFRRLGLRTGSRAALLVTPGPDMMVMAFGLIKIGAVPIMIDPGIGKKNFKSCIEESDPVAFFGIPAAHLGRILLGWGKKSVRINIIAGPSIPLLGTGLYSLLKKESPAPPDWEFPEPDDLAAIVFTSGSTGPSKGVIYTHRMFLAQASMQKKQFDIKPGEVDLATFPLFAMFDPYWETTTVFPDMDFTRPGKVNPRKLIATIKKYSATHMFGSPALLSRVSAYGKKHQIKLPSLLRVFSAGAPVPHPVIKNMVGLLAPEGKLHTPYGATEALPVSTISHEELLRLVEEIPPGSGTCIGRCLPGVSLDIISITDDPIPKWKNSLLVKHGEVGELVVHGDNVSKNYFRRPDADSLAKISSNDGTIRHRMGDLGYLDSEGRIWFCGRKTHRVVTSSGDLYSVLAEGVFNQHPDVFRSALAGTGKAPNQVPVICIELSKGFSRTRQALGKLTRELLETAAKHDNTRQVKTILYHPGFPVDIRHNSKISREKLAIWAEGRN